MKAHIRIPAPHSDVQRKIYYALRPDFAPRLTIVSCGTKFGKSVAGSGALVNSFPSHPNGIWRWIAPIYKQSRIGVRYVRKMVPGSPYTSWNKSDMELSLNPPLDSKLCQFWHAQSPEDLEGEGTRGNVIDEGAKAKEQAFLSAWTTITMTNGKILVLSTPRGKKNWFYRKYVDALDEMRRAEFENRHPKMLALTAPSSANPFLPQEAVEDARKQLPLRLFEQYYEAKFVDDGSTFMGLDQCINGPIVDILPSPVQIWMREGHEECETIVGGIDWAKRRDFTVATAIDFSKKPYRLMGLMRFQNVKYTEAIIHCVKFFKRFKAIEMVNHDKTGVGDAIDDMLDEVPNFPYNGITFTLKSKPPLVTRYVTAIEQGDLDLPNWDYLIQEHDQFEVSTTPSGNVQYEAAEGFHDDIVMSLVLAYSAAEEYSDDRFEVKFLEDLPKRKDLDTLESWYKDGLDIDEDEGF